MTICTTILHNPEHADRITDVPFVDTYDTIEDQIESFYMFEESVFTNKSISNAIKEVTLSLCLLLLLLSYLKMIENGS